VHAHRKDASLHTAAAQHVRELAESMQAWGICYHSLVEFYSIATHPRIWKQPSTPEQTWHQISAWRNAPYLRILSDSAESLQALRALAINSKVTGPLIHDARIAACCLSHSVQELWTVDRDFTRFPALKTRNPLV